MTDMQATASGFQPYPVQPKLDVVEATKATWRIFRRQPWRFIWLLVIPILVTFPVQIVQAIVQVGVQSAAGKNSGAAIGVAVVFTLIVLVVQYGTQFTCQMAGMWGAARNMDGGRFTTMEALKVGFGRLLPYLGLFFLLFLIVMIGFILLVIPGIIASGYLAVAGAACVLERRGPIESMKRSYYLVTGNWWRSFGMVLLTIFAPILAFAATALVIYLVFAAMNLKMLSLILILPGIPFFLVMIAVATIAPAVLFLELRAAKEGRTHGTVAGVFE